MMVEPDRSPIAAGTGEAIARLKCNHDLSDADCNRCLDDTTELIPKCCDKMAGGRVITPSCSFIYEISKFYKSSIEGPVESPTPLPDPKGICITIRDATDNFSDANKLGQGGFVAIYKGMLSDGEQIVVKRLAMNSKQGDLEFKNEVIYVAKLQHRNLVRLLDSCLERKERIIVYEFLPNSSIDHFIFDFGMARLFEMDQTQSDTNRVVGTLFYFERCLHIGLLYVQESVSDRPTMGYVVVMLNSENVTLSAPSKPGFFMHNSVIREASSSSSSSSSLSPQKYYSGSTKSDQVKNVVVPMSRNDVTITELCPQQYSRVDDVEFFKMFVLNSS
ncbi:hypothetical protein Ddye_032160 [Dipteronia dyeriana]|uniref:Uncharacterized protein n=1 Tax=Dipteronia dyeriana TaxID=168575 RepID=A0AAD9WPA0_9ROSI|nr:hypothetical protein Ddye_032160 [Dipteronia dyeriana]